MLTQLIDTINHCQTLSRQCHQVAIRRDIATEHYFDQIHQHFKDAIANNARTTTILEEDKVQPPPPNEKVSSASDNKEEQLPSTTQVEAILAENKQLKEKLRQMHDIFVKLKGSATTMTDIATQHTQQAKIEKETTFNIRQQLNDLIKEYDSIRSERDVLQNQVQQLQQQINALERSKEELFKAPRSNDEMVKKMNDLIIMRNNAEAALRAIMDTQTAAEDQSRSTITALRSNIETLSKELDKETKAKHTFSALCDDLQDDLEDARDTVRYHEKKLSKKRASIVDLQNTINQLRQSNKTKKTKMTELYRRISSLENQCAMFAAAESHAAKKQRIE
ncbi:hypothetical protein K492DRAFT_202594 [Lichtheimia hyalospora FSU 10163]|nr:hypothetical protein K492DRAFT_202594 [Lichtheimia hyalospora FSU 10163]